MGHQVPENLHAFRSFRSKKDRSRDIPTRLAKAADEAGGNGVVVKRRG
jgi:hypothetical protein